ncbi:hybrid sensor histidine kinase/response regulator transcription factor [Flavobacterium oncorhynchi]|nr:hybrid sensor histidine kinase/response regulator transcription factor [Flavobacterium oncorhynchi]
MKNSIQLLLALFFSSSMLFSQNIRHLSVDEGLPQSFVSGIVENKDGFIWLSTRNGLARFDGHNFKIFQHIHNNKNSLTSNLIEQIKESDSNTLWIKYESGELDKFNYNTEKANPVITQSFLEKNNITISRRVWFVDHENMLWFRTKDNNVLCKIDLSDKKKLVNYGSYFSKYGPIYNIIETYKKELWVLSQKAISKFDKKKNKFIPIIIPYQLFPEGFKDDGIVFNAFTERKNGELMWADNSFIYFFNPIKKEFRKVSLPVKSLFPVRYIDADTEGKEFFILEKTIYEYSDKKGIISMATIKMDANAQAFLVDKSGLFWVAGDADGVYTIDTSIDFASFDYKEGFIADLFNQYYHIPALQFFDWKFSNAPLTPSYYLRSVKIKDGVWIALNRTVALFDNYGSVVTKLPQLPKVPETPFAPIIGFSLYNDNPIALDRENSIYFFNKEKNEWEFFISLNTLSVHPKKKIVCRGMHADMQGNALWITTESHGLIRIAVDTKKVELYQKSEKGLPINNLISIRPDYKRKDVLWLGSSIGLISFNTITRKTKVFSVEEGFPDNFIYLILPDKMGNLWLGTNKGLVRFNTITYRTRIFTKYHGLNNLEFNHYHQLPLPHNKIAFGGLKSGVVFNPVSIMEDTVSPVTVVTDIKINNVFLNDLRPSLQPAHTLKDLKLSHEENNLFFSYAALQFGQPLGNQYRYRLKGYDDSWVTAGIKREAVFTKIPPGNYTFQVTATNTSGKWSSHITSLPISITPPWWFSRWAILFYILISSAGVLWYFRFKIHQALIKKEIELKRHEASELRKLNDVKIRFFSNIAHELRTPLSLIQGPAEQLQKSTKDKDRLLKMITKNTSSLINLTDQLLDIAKLDAGVLNPEMIWGDVVMVISNIISAFEQDAEEKNIKIILEAPEIAEFLFSVNTLDRILYNLISNALKFTEAGGTIKVSLVKLTIGLMLKVQDNGRGMSVQDKENIFKRYYQGTNNSTEKKGTGIGLSLVYELVQLHKGTINVESRTAFPSGTTFSVWLPFSVQRMQIQIDEIPTAAIDEKKYTILVVEDHLELAQFIADNLREIYNVITAKNGDEGLDICFEKMPDLILSDITMEGMDGYKFCRAVKNNITINHIPVILLTAKADMESRLKGLAIGANDYVTKPFSINELRLRIKNQLDQQKKLRDNYHNSLIKPLENNTRIESESDKFLNEIYKIIDANLDNNNLSVEMLAESLFISRANLQRKVKILFNLSAGEIINSYRITKAAEFLKNGNSISDVVYMTGFNSPSYFSKSFKDYYKVTPTEYVKKY